MNLGFKIEIQASIYKLPGRILTYTQLVDQIQQNFKERVPLKFKISYSSNDESESINVCCDQDFKVLLACANERNMKNIKLKITEQTEDENILKDLDESMFNWCDLIDRFDIEDPQLNNQQSQSLSCFDKSVNNGITGLFNEEDNKAFASQNDLEEKLSQLEMDFSKGVEKNTNNNCEKQNNKNEKKFNLEEDITAAQQQTERLINLDESAIIFIRSENYSPMIQYKDYEQSTEHLPKERQNKATTDYKQPSTTSDNNNCTKITKPSVAAASSSAIYSPQTHFLKTENQIKLFYRLNEEKLEQTKRPFPSSINDQMLINQCFDNQQQADSLVGCNQIAPTLPHPLPQGVHQGVTTSHSSLPSSFQTVLTSFQNVPSFIPSPLQAVPSIPLTQNVLPPKQNSIKNDALSSVIFPTHSDITHNRNSNQGYCYRLSMPPHFGQQSSSSFNQSPMNIHNQPQTSQDMQQNCMQNFSSQIRQEEEEDEEQQQQQPNNNTTTIGEQHTFAHVNNRRKSKTTIQLMPIPSKLTTSICVDNVNQSTADHSQISFLNGSNQTNIGANSILSRKIGRWQVPDQSLNQSTSQNDINSKISPFSQRNSVQQMFCSQNLHPQLQQQLNHTKNEDVSNLQGIQQGFQNMIKACGNNNNKSSNTSNNSPDNFIRENKNRRLSYKIPCQQVCHYRAKIINSPKKSLCVAIGQQFSWNLTFQNNGECEWPENVMLRCIEGFSDGGSYTVSGNADSCSIVSVEVNFTAPNKPGISKNSFRLCYQQEDQCLKYFGPKVTFELTVQQNMEIDNLMTTFTPIHFNSPNLSLSGKLSTQIPSSQFQIRTQQIEDTPFSSQSSLNVQNPMSNSLIKISPSDQFISAVSQTSISPMKQETQAAFEHNQNEQLKQGDKFNEIETSNFESISEIQYNQVPLINLEQFYAQQPSHHHHLPFRRSINTN